MGDAVDLFGGGGENEGRTVVCTFGNTVLALTWAETLRMQGHRTIVVFDPLWGCGLVFGRNSTR